MEEFAQDLMKQLESKVAFEIPIFGGIPVASSVVVTWFVMVILVLLSVVFVRNLKLVPTGAQVYAEAIVGGMNDFFEDILGEEGRIYFSYLSTVTIYIGVTNLLGLIGVTPPTKDLNITAGLAILSICLIEYSGLHARGFKGWLRSFSEPMALLTPINIMELFIRPISLCMRLFGNILGSFVIMELLRMVAPVILPIPFSFYFDIFDGLIQTYVFVFLTSLFMKERMEVSHS